MKMFLIGFLSGTIVTYTSVRFFQSKKSWQYNRKKKSRNDLTSDPELGIKEEFFRKKRNLPIWILRK